MDTTELEAVIRPIFAKGFDGVIRVELIGEPVSVWVDGRGEAATVSADSPTGVEGRFCLWRIDPLDVPLVLVADERRLENGFVSGRLKISGDMSVMARLEIAGG